jgi:hypothetical protein
MPCPFLEEIVMVYCRAYPVRKLIPSHKVTTDSPCMGEGYQKCPFFQEHAAGVESVFPRQREGVSGEREKEVP